MARVTDAEVKTILSTTVDTAPFINSANLLVSDKLGDSGDLSSDQLKNIELWLAAHMACALDPQIESKGISSVNKTYQGQFGLGLDSTRYGQMVKILDVTGILASIGRKKASIEALDY